jgi:hypothetical protein
MYQQYRLGDTREDGKIFFCKSSTRGDIWVSSDAYDRHRFRVALTSARKRAAKKKVPFDVTIDYLMSIYPPDGMCPIFNIPMIWGGEQNTSPSLDRIKPELGYTEGNLMWISGYANNLKSSNTIDTLRILLAFYENIGNFKDNE